MTLQIFKKVTLFYRWRNRTLTWLFYLNKFIRFLYICHTQHEINWYILHFSHVPCTIFIERIQVHFNRDFIGEKCCLLWDLNPRPSDLISSGGGYKSPCGIFTSLWFLTFFHKIKFVGGQSLLLCWVNQLLPRCWKWRDLYLTQGDYIWL